MIPKKRPTEEGRGEKPDTLKPLISKQEKEIPKGEMERFTKAVAQFVTETIKVYPKLNVKDTFCMNVDDGREFMIIRIK